MVRNELQKHDSRPAPPLCFPLHAAAGEPAPPIPLSPILIPRTLAFTPPMGDGDAGSEDVENVELTEVSAP